MRLSQIEFKDHPILKNLKISFVKDNGEIYSNIIFVGENGCGKTTILNELFNYDNSAYIVNKEQNFNLCGQCGYKSIYIAQDIKFRNAVNNINEKIKGDIIYKDITDIDNTNGYEGANYMSLNKNNIVNDNRMLVEKLNDFHNERIKEFLMNKNERLMDDISKQVSIDGNISIPKVDTYSSGEQELILRLETIKNRVSLNLDMILIDEPETSLHPKWQLEIIPFILKILKDNNSGERDLQLFIVSHSENVLKSIFDRDDTLIVSLYKDNDEIKSQSITNMDTVLTKTTIAEIQYLVFDIISSEYHNQLYGKFLSLCGGNQSNVASYLREKYKNNLQEVLNKYEYSYNDKLSIEVLPTYIRNATDHPENTDRIYNNEDLKKSIELLRKEIKEFKK